MEPRKTDGRDRRLASIVLVAIIVFMPPAVANAQDSTLDPVPVNPVDSAVPIGGPGPTASSSAPFTPPPAAASAWPELWVDFTTDALVRDGSQLRPFRTLRETLLQAAPGDMIQLQPGDTNETLRIAQPVRLEAPLGLVRIGLASLPDVYFALDKVPNIYLRNTTPLDITVVANDRGRGGSDITALDWRIVDPAATPDPISPPWTALTFTPADRVDVTFSIADDAFGPVDPLMPLHADFRLEVRATDAAGAVAVVSHAMFVFDDLTGAMTLTAQENSGNPILIGEELTFTVAGEIPTRLYIGGFEAGIPGLPPSNSDEINGRVPTRIDLFVDPAVGIPAQAVTGGGVVFEFALKNDGSTDNSVHRLALALIGKVREVAVIDVTNPAQLNFLDHSLIDDGPDGDILPPFGAIAISSDGRVAILGKDNFTISPDIEPNKQKAEANNIAVINIIQEVELDPLSVDSPEGTGVVNIPDNLNNAENDLFLSPSAIVMLSGEHQQNQALILSEEGIWPNNTSIPPTDDRLGLIVDFSDFSTNPLFAPIIVSPFVQPMNGNIDETTVPPSGRLYNVGGTMTHDGRYALICQGPFNGHVNVIDLQSDPPDLIWPPIDPTDPVDITDTNWLAPNNGSPTAPRLEGPADIAVTRDGTLAFISNGLLESKKVQALSIDLSNPPFTEPNNRAVSIKANIPVLNANDPDHLISMGLSLSRSDQFAFYANTHNHSIAVIDVNAVVQHSEPAQDCLDCLNSVLFLIPDINNPSNDFLTLNTLNDGLRVTVPNSRTGPYDIAIDPRDRFILLTSSRGIFSLSTDALKNGGELALFGLAGDPDNERGQLELFYFLPDLVTLASAQYPIPPMSLDIQP